MSKTLPKVTIYTDGSCEPNPGAGGWGALLLFKDSQIPLSGAHPDTTNNRMELTAAVEALQALPGRHQVEIYTDSEYLKRGITEWMPNWRARKWKRKGGKLANVELWKALDRALQPHQVNWHWVKAHATSKFNNQVDRLAREAMKRGR
jgi:ribonuclease HI